MYPFLYLGQFAYVPNDKLLNYLVVNKPLSVYFRLGVSRTAIDSRLSGDSNIDVCNSFSSVSIKPGAWGWDFGVNRFQQPFWLVPTAIKEKGY